jgi:hypothetical protein
MERFIINTVVMNRYQLIEEIEIDRNLNYQIWGVLDTQNNQKIIGKFWQDGRVEWFNPIGWTFSFDWFFSFWVHKTERFKQLLR